MMPRGALFLSYTVGFTVVSFAGEPPPIASLVAGSWPCMPASCDLMGDVASNRILPVNTGHLNGGYRDSCFCAAFR